MAKTAQEVRDLITSINTKLAAVHASGLSPSQEALLTDLHGDLAIASTEVGERWEDLFPDDEEGGGMARSTGGDKE